MCSCGLSKRLHAAFKRTIKRHFAGRCKRSGTSAPFMWMACQLGSFHLCDREADGIVDCFCLFSWRRWKDGRVKRAGWSRETGRGSLGVDPAHAALACIITHSLSATLPCSVTLCLFSFLPHSPFILDLLSWWRWWRRWWVSLYDTERSVRNTKQNWDRFSTLHRSLWRIAPFCQVHCAAHSSCTSSLLCASVGAAWAPTSAQFACFPF